MVISKENGMSGSYRDSDSSPVVRKIKSNKLPVAIAVLATVCVIAKVFWPSQVKWSDIFCHTFRVLALTNNFPITKIIKVKYKRKYRREKEGKRETFNFYAPGFIDKDF